MNKEESGNRGSLWLKTSKSGSKYYNGSITIEGTEYWLTMFNNDKKGNPKAPDYRLVAEPKETQETVPAIAEEKEEDPYKDFGKQNELEITDDDLPF